MLEYNLIESVGKLDAPGKPTMYSVTSEFMRMFGIESLEELPELPRYKLDENQQIVIDDLIQEEQKEEATQEDNSAEAPSPEREGEVEK